MGAGVPATMSLWWTTSASHTLLPSKPDMDDALKISGTVHQPVLLDAVLELLDPQLGQVMVDGTFGGGGHARAIAQRVGSGGLVIGLDRDAAAVERAERSDLASNIRLFHHNYLETGDVLGEVGVAAADGILLDLGLSSDQLADAGRGFSFTSDGPLDLRFDVTSGRPASELANRLPEKRLADLIYGYGEERLSRRIARKIVEARRQAPIKTARQLADVILSAVPRPKPGRGYRIHPATRTFQALRIAVNEELDVLAKSLARAPDWLCDGGRIAVISFHSLEDRLVKNAFRGDSRYQILTKKPISARDEELADNPRSRSAKLRGAVRAPRNVP